MQVFRIQMSYPLVHETLAMFLDDQRRGSTLISVGGTIDPASLVEVAETMAMLASESFDLSGLVLASVRPRGGPLPGDDDRWFEAADIAESWNIDLIDWLIIGDQDWHSPRDMLGVPSQWSVGA